LQIGLGHIFSSAADFSGISTADEPLKMSKVIQKAFIEVCEEGLETSETDSGTNIQKFSHICLNALLIALQIGLLFCILLFIVCFLPKTYHSKFHRYNYVTALFIMTLSNRLFYDNFIADVILHTV
jgi:hypothetical protein